jgi:hypothetical protein
MSLTLQGRNMTSLSQQFQELLRTQASLSDDRSQRASAHTLVVGHNYLGKRLVVAQHDVTPFLSLEVETCLRQRLNTVLT